MKPKKNNPIRHIQLPPAEINPLITLYNTGRYAELESKVRFLVGQHPDFGFGWKLLGGALQMQGKNALPAFQKTAELMPNDADAHYNLGVALKSSGLLAEAAASYRWALKIKPDYAEAHSNLGNVLQDLGQLNNAAASYRSALKIKPDSAEMHNSLGIALKDLGQFDDALASYRHALALKPNYADAHYNLGNALIALGQLDDAVTSFRHAIKIESDFAEAHNNLGVALNDLGQLDAALASYRRALQLKPDYAEAYNNLGTAFKDLGQLDDAAATYRRALECQPDFSLAYYNLGNVLKELGQLIDAVATYRRALEFQPQYADAHSNLGFALKDIGQYEAALESYRRALELKPDSAEAHYDLANSLKYLGYFDSAMASYRRALEINPDYIETQSNLLFTLNFIAGQEPAYCLAEAQLYGRMVAKKVTSRFSTWQCTVQPHRLRVGIVSGDLRNHPVGFFLESLLAQLDPGRVELIAYPTNPVVDNLTNRIKPYFAAWKPLFGLSDEAAAHLIHADSVHILLDLSGHTGHNRLPVFAWKAAPVQASWLGYFATTGVAEMDYLLADKVGVPEGQRGNFSETVWYLPDTRICFTAPEVDLPATTLPALKNGHITFGCFQNLPKVGDEVLMVWGRILSVLPDAKLRWQCKQLGDSAVAKQQVLRLQRQGIDPARVSLHGAVSREAYLAAHGEVDVMLDTFPYPGGTTTCEALWMGVPTLTLAGESLLARQGKSLLTAAGLEDWVAASVVDYIDQAVALTNDLPKLAALRTRLREQVIASPLFDASRFARNFEAALWGMWQARVQPSLNKPHELLTLK